MHAELCLATLPLVIEGWSSWASSHLGMPGTGPQDLGSAAKAHVGTMTSILDAVSPPSCPTTPRFDFQNETDDNQIQLVGGDVELPKELAKMIEQDNEEEEEKNSVIGQLSNIQNLDLDSLKDKASATLEDLKQSAEKCAVM